jgi:YegS/Rv2252/BmrU family lipid kinase
MNRNFVIFNPVARGDKSRRLRAFLEQRVGEDSRLTLLPTTRAGEATRLAAQAVADGASLVVAAGGDGTINEVVNGIAGHDVTLGVLPLGTVNVLARELGIPLSLRQSWELLRSGRTRTIDLGCATAQGRQRYFVQLAGVGLDAWAVRHASWELKKRIGPLSYVWAGLKTLRQALPDVLVEASSPASGPAVLVGNGRFYGGSFPMFPQARMDDGLLDVCVFEKGGYGDVMRYGAAMLRGGRHVKLPDVHYVRVSEFLCSSPAEVTPFELDGEDAGNGPVRFHVLPSALRIVSVR